MTLLLGVPIAVIAATLTYLLDARLAAAGAAFAASVWFFDTIVD